MLKHSGSTIDQLKIFVKRGNFSPVKNKMPRNRRARWQQYIELKHGQKKRIVPFASIELIQVVLKTL